MPQPIESLNLKKVQTILTRLESDSSFIDDFGRCNIKDREMTIIDTAQDIRDISPIVLIPVAKTLLNKVIRFLYQSMNESEVVEEIKRALDSKDIESMLENYCGID